MNRRRFLKKAAAATATTASLSSLGSGLAPSANPGKKLSVAIIGCGRMGQHFAEVYRTLPDTDLVAIAEWNDERRPIVGKRFGVGALYKDVHGMLREIIPDLAVVVTPTKFMKEAVIACAEAGVKGVSTEKPIAARLSDADAMVEACSERGIVFAGGNLQSAKWTVQQAARRLRAGDYGKLVGAAVHQFSGEISGGGCQHLCVLRLFTGAEVEEVTAWGSPPEALEQESDHGLNINGHFRMSSGLEVQVFSAETPYRGIDVWTEEALVRWDWAAPQIFRGTDEKGARRQIDPHFPPFPWNDVLKKTPGLQDSDDYLVSSIRSFIDAVATGSKLWISGHDLRQALEIAIASKLSAQLGNQPVRLPLQDRSLALYPKPYRWVGGDAAGRPQSPEEAAGKGA